MRKGNKVLLIAAAVIIVLLGWWALSSPKIEVKTINMTPRQANDYNVELLPAKKQSQIYSYLIIVRAPFKGKDYVTVNSEDAVTVTGSGTETRAHIYTNNPGTKRLTQYIQ